MLLLRHDCDVVRHQRTGLVHRQLTQAKLADERSQLIMRKHMILGRPDGAVAVAELDDDHQSVGPHETGHLVECGAVVVHVMHSVDGDQTVGDRVSKRDATALGENRLNSGGDARVGGGELGLEAVEELRELLDR
jgi:hypothetical protein